MERDTQVVAERLEIGGVRFVMNVFHPHVTCLNGEVWYVHLGTTGEEFQQTKGILATRQADEDFVVLGDQLELPQRFVERLPEFLFKIHRCVCYCATQQTYNYFINTR